MTGVEIVIGFVSKWLILPLKMLVIAVASAIARWYFNEKPIKLSQMIGKIFISTFVLVSVFYGLKEFTDFGESACLMFGGVAGFTSEELLNFIVKVAKNPSKAKKIIKGGEIDIKDDE